MFLQVFVDFGVKYLSQGIDLCWFTIYFVKFMIFVANICHIVWWFKFFLVFKIKWTSRTHHDTLFPRILIWNSFENLNHNSMSVKRKKNSWLIHFRDKNVKLVIFLSQEYENYCQRKSQSINIAFSFSHRHRRKNIRA